MISPTAPACVAQDDVEPLLLAHLRTAGGRVALGTEVTALVATGDGATVHLRDVGSGAASVVHARYVVAADGARSTLRRALGIELVGPDELMAGFTTLFRAPLWDVVGRHRHVIYSVDATARSCRRAGPTAGCSGTTGDPTAPPADRTVAELIRARAGVPGLPVRIEHTRFFSAAAQLAETWRCGAVFLAGDAAHRVTPRGGTGLNLALHDGYDLGWKLAWVLRGWAPPALLDTYESDRRPVVAYTADRSADPTARCARRDRGRRRPRRPHPPRVVGRPVDARPARPRADAVRGARRRAAARGSRAADHRARARADRRTRRRRAGAGPLRRDAGQTGSSKNGVERPSTLTVMPGWRRAAARASAIAAPSGLRRCSSVRAGVVLNHSVNGRGSAAARQSAIVRITSGSGLLFAPSAHKT